MLTKNILFLGCGQMGLAILKIVLNHFNSDHNQIKILKKNPLLTDQSVKNIEIVDDLVDLPQNFCADLVFCCVKPQDIEDVLSGLIKSKKTKQDTVFISIIAGKKIEYFKRVLGKDSKIIRTMPNLAIKNDCGILPYLASDDISQNEVESIVNIFKDSAEIFALNDEELFDVITAIFGCGPAYLLLLQEILSEIAVKNGLEEGLSNKLIKKLFLGSALIADSSDSFLKSRQAVTSKNGVTQNLTDILQKDESLKKLFTKAINHAISRSKELS